MARLEIEFGGLAERFGDIDGEIECKMIDEAMPIYVDSVKKSLKAVIKHDGDSELVESIKVKKEKEAQYGDYIAVITPKGKSKTKHYYRKNKRHKKKHRKYALTNGAKAIWLEYGIPGRQPAKPYIANAQKNAEEPVLKKMQEVFDREVGAL